MLHSSSHWHSHTAHHWWLHHWWLHHSLLHHHWWLLHSHWLLHLLLLWSCWLIVHAEGTFNGTRKLVFNSLVEGGNLSQVPLVGAASKDDESNCSDKGGNESHSLGFGEWCWWNVAHGHVRLANIDDLEIELAQSILLVLVSQLWSIGDVVSWHFNEW